MNTFLKLLRYNLTPVKKGRWVFTSFRGHYSDNPKAISEKLHALAPEMEIVWLVEERFLSLLPSYVTGVDIHTKAAEKYGHIQQVMQQHKMLATTLVFLFLSECGGTQYGKNY